MSSTKSNERSDNSYAQLQNGLCVKNHNFIDFSLQLLRLNNVNYIIFKTEMNRSTSKEAF